MKCVNIAIKHLKIQKQDRFCTECYVFFYFNYSGLTMVLLREKQVDWIEFLTQRQKVHKACMDKNVLI